MSSNHLTRTRDLIRAVTPKLSDLTDRVLYGEVWERPGLSKRDRSLITVAALVALAPTGQLKTHIDRALDNGVTKDEIGELITHIAFYAGWPAATSAALVTIEAYKARDESQNGGSLTGGK